MTSASIVIERRTSADRRRSPTSPFGRMAWHGKRHGARRTEDRVNTYVDRYEPHLFYAAIATLLLCCADAFFTLTLLQQGAEEINPFMAWLLEIDIQLFLATKFALTAAGLVFLVAHKNFLLFNQRFRVPYVLYAFLAGYVLLVKYELVLLGF
ncbi:MAG: hypothetical protein IDH49_15245 [Gammaproteobacteria bacterium]|nr:hypothetical protein [Gammaproteobacteria bacterium]